MFQLRGMAKEACENYIMHVYDEFKIKLLESRDLSHQLSWRCFLKRGQFSLLAVNFNCSGGSDFNSSDS